MNILKKDCAILVTLLVVSSCFFYYVNSQIKPINEWATLKYSTPDSTTYLNVGKWLLNETEFDTVKSSVAIRPFFYPLIVATLELIHPFAVPILQFLLWQVQILIVYFFCRKILYSRMTSFFVAVISISIISPVGISLHVLTETLSSFLIVFSVLMLLLYKQEKTYFYILLHLLSLSFCAVTRPAVLYLYFISMIVSVFEIKKIKIIFYIFITSMPIFTQAYIMNKKFDTYTLSFIDTITINDYFSSLIEMRKRNIDVDNMIYRRIFREETRKIMANAIENTGYKEASKIVKEKMIINFVYYPVQTLKQMRDLIVENSMQPSFYVSSGIGIFNYPLITFIQSKMLVCINILSLLFIIFIFFLQKKTKIKKYDMFSFTGFFYIFFTYLSTGITFWQGDRFLIPIYYVSIILFVYQTKNLFSVIRNVSYSGMTAC